MIKAVIKKNGKKQPFSASKLRGSVERAIIAAGYQLEMKKGKVNKVIKWVMTDLKGEKDVKSSKLRVMVLKRLGAAESSALKAWKKFDRKYKNQDSAGNELW